jgi:hypothetical protein
MLCSEGQPHDEISPLTRGLFGSARVGFHVQCETSVHHSFFPCHGEVCLPYAPHTVADTSRPRRGCAWGSCGSSAARSDTEATDLGSGGGGREQVHGGRVAWTSRDGTWICPWECLGAGLIPVAASASARVDGGQRHHLGTHRQLLRSSGGPLALQAVVPLSWWWESMPTQHGRLRRDARLRHCQLERQREHSTRGAADSRLYVAVSSQPRRSRDMGYGIWDMGYGIWDAGTTCWLSGAAGRRATVPPALDCSCAAQGPRGGRGHYWPGALVSLHRAVHVTEAVAPSTQAGWARAPRCSAGCGQPQRGEHRRRGQPPLCRSAQPLFLCRFTPSRAGPWPPSASSSPYLEALQCGVGVEAV